MSYIDVRLILDMRSGIHFRDVSGVKGSDQGLRWCDVLGIFHFLGGGRGHLLFLLLSLLYLRMEGKVFEKVFLYLDEMISYRELP